ncbi:leucine-rich repeat-containing protein 23 [Salarias fasciatus]|uniref:leucine-rich repeat-containing protein 23 n=1 Tax=Salarias fasciatus TaxID=181472 RepID=UPI001176E099|nr:leucine-rich repeat-containing protein 23 [Salarias fasciatus]
MSDMEEDAVLSDVDGDEETKEVTDEDKVQVCQLTSETIGQGLSLLCRTANRLAHAFVKLDLKDKGLNDIAAISSYIHIRFLDLSNNLLTDLSPLSSLTHLLWLKVDNNAVSCFKGQPFTQLTYLQWLSIAANRLTGLDNFVGSALESLNLTGNGIQDMTGFQSVCFTNLVTLELRGNHLTTTAGIDLPNLKRLYLAQNAIKHLEGLEKLECLNILHLRDNQVESLDGLSQNMKCLQYLNVRGNLIADEAALRCLGLVSKTLRALVLSDNPLVDSPDYRLSVLMVSPLLQRLDKDPVSSEERDEAQQRIRELKEEEMPEAEN